MMMVLKAVFILNLLLLVSCSALRNDALTKLESNAPLVYLNKSFGFSVEGYKYQQSEIPCKIEANMVTNLVKRAAKKGIRMEPVSSAEKILEAEVPVLAIDIDGLVLAGKETSYGIDNSSSLPSIKITSAYISKREGQRFSQSAKHSCAIITLNELTPSSDIMDMGTGVTVCSAIRKCLRSLSSDVMKWLTPQVIEG